MEKKSGLRGTVSSSLFSREAAAGGLFYLTQALTVVLEEIVGFFFKSRNNLQIKSYECRLYIVLHVVGLGCCLGVMFQKYGKQRVFLVISFILYQLYIWERC